MVLKLGAEYGLNLYDIGMILYKPGFNEETPADVEKLIEKTQKICSLYKLSNIVLMSTSEETEKDNDTGDNSEFILDKIPHELEGGHEMLVNTDLEENSHLRRKKNSLLKRTASEPKLNKIDSADSSFGNVTESQNSIAASELNTHKEDMNGLTNNIKTIKLNNTKANKVSNLTQTKKTYKEKLPFQNSTEEEAMDSPFNEVFFYNFENVLIDYLQVHPKVAAKTNK